jgi:putative flippase GtrA
MIFQTLNSRIPISFWRFALVGIGGLFVDMTILYIVMWGLGLAPVTAKVFSFLGAATFTWWMNRLYTFGCSDKSLLYEWTSFLATNAFGGAVNFAVYIAMVTQLFLYGWMPALATAMGSLSGLLFNYMASRHIVFNRSQQRETKLVQSRKRSRRLPRFAYLLTLLMFLVFCGVVE